MKILSEFYFTNQLLQSDFNCENFYVNVKFEKKIYKPEDILKNTNKEYMFNLICFPKECEKIFEDLYNN